jgi:uncharacterized membrane protein
MPHRFDSHFASRFDDQRMETIMGRLLQLGVSLASLVVLIGGFLYLRAHPGSTADYRTFTGEPANLRSAGGLFGLLRSGDPQAVIQIGVLLLIATPIARVVFAVAAFALERDRFYVAVSLTVLAVLMISLFCFS